MTFKPHVIEGGLDAPFWKDNPEFRQNILFRGTCWWIYLNPQQRYLGRAYAWLTTRHVPNHPVHDLAEEELKELMILLRLYDQTIHALGWNPQLVNYHWDGNEGHLHDGHGHLHIIPRYATPPVFDGMTFPDMRFGKNHAPYEKLDLPEGLFFKIHDRISREIQYLWRAM
ncbi:MAG TPA: hypothetical protein VGN56_00440 [Candidatus Paceibacterota bacterium]|jgi:diadenosine tetraphosphate (Ap4A) HIT family hydrolase|nr:hypothetical protein [Candidatus Paceibacterota bacterium]